MKVNGFLCFLMAGLEDSTMGTVADTVARVLRGCVENMPEGMKLYLFNMYFSFSYVLCFNIVSLLNWYLLLIFGACFFLTANDISKESLNCSFQWVTKWVDYSNKYGFGYQLSDHTVGVLFNNGTHMSLLSDKK